MNAIELNRTALGNDELANIVEEIAAKMQAGEPCDIDDYMARFPDYADRLREWMNVMEAMADLGHSLATPVAGGSDTSHVGEFLRTTQSVPAPNDPPATGILGDFRILREIGRGGMGVVYEAEQISLGRRVALKVLPFAAMLDKQQLARFKNEARAAATLDHPNIVAIYSVGAERGVHYYAMQLIEGRSLAEVIAALRDKSVVRGPLSVAKTADSPATDDGPRTADPCASDHARPAGPVGLGGATITGRSPSPEGTDVKLPLVPSPTAGDTAKAALPTVKAGGSAVLSNIPAFETRAYFTAIARLGIQAAEALDHAHQSGILHRDIKPANLLMDDSGKLWVTDFGLARIEQDAGMTMTGDLLGTLRYMSPEQALAKRVVVDHRSDIYSLGVTLYELLALRPAFAGDDRQELLRRIAFDEPRKPREFNSRIPHDLETIICKSIEKNPSDRYASGKDLADDLKRFVTDQPIKAKPQSLYATARKWARRHSDKVLIASGAATILAVACSSAAVMTLNAYRAEALQRKEAEQNLTIAADAIGNSVHRTYKNLYQGGEIELAQESAITAAEFYERLLQRTVNPQLRFEAARVYFDIALMWNFIGNYERQEVAVRRTLELIDPLIASEPDRAEYLAIRTGALVQTAISQFRQSQFDAAEISYRNLITAFERLIELDPKELKHRAGLAGITAGLADIDAFQNRWDEAEDGYKRSEELFNEIPKDFYTRTPDAMTRRAGLYTNWAMLCSNRGDYDRASRLLADSIALQKMSLAGWPTNPMARDGLYRSVDTLCVNELRAGRHEKAAAAINELVKNFPNRISAYNLGVNRLIACADHADKVAKSSDDSSLQASAKLAAEAYRKRAQELVELGTAAEIGSPDEIISFSWLLITRVELTDANTEAAIRLINRVGRADPENAKAWRVLALASYRNSELDAADVSAKQVLQYAKDDGDKVYAWLFYALIDCKQGDMDEAHQWYNKATEWMDKNQPSDKALNGLAMEVAVTLGIKKMPE